MRNRTAAILAVVAAGVLVAACGGSSPQSSTGSINGPSFKQAKADAYKHSDCMRSHGISDFPDPKIINQPGKQGIGINVQGINVTSPAFLAAQKACAHLMPGANGPNHHVGSSAAEQRKHQQALLALARCMRGKGFPRFPDPNSQGNIDPEMFTQAGINIQQPAFVSGAESCASVTDGVITVNEIKRALAQGPSSSHSASGTQTSPGG